MTAVSKAVHVSPSLDSMQIWKEPTLFFSSSSCSCCSSLRNLAASNALLRWTSASSAACWCISFLALSIRSPSKLAFSSHIAADVTFFCSWHWQNMDLPSLSSRTVSLLCVNQLWGRSKLDWDWCKYAPHTSRRRTTTAISNAKTHATRRAHLMPFTNLYKMWSCSQSVFHFPSSLYGNIRCQYSLDKQQQELFSDRIQHDQQAEDCKVRCEWQRII